jgi:type IV pilus assembly protein PilB
MTPQSSAELQKKIKNIRRDAEERDAKRRAAQNGTTYADLRKTPVSIEAIRLISEEDAREGKMAAIEVKTRELAVAVFDPALQKTKEIIARLAERHFVPKVFTASLSGLEEVRRMYKFVPEESEDITGTFQINQMEEMIKTIHNLQGVQEMIAKSDFKRLSTTQLFQVVLAGALASGASDIHFEAEEEAARIRFRLDGALHDAFVGLPQRNYDSLVSRIKLLSGLKINIHGEPQDGRFTIALPNKEIEMRVSIIPSEFGETIVMRILDPDSINVNINQLGVRADDMKIIEAVLAQPNGLILNTGPTGSGKTTTLYAFLRHIVNPEIKIITVEDPIEYRIAGIEQTQVNPDVGYTFAGGLRAILRQDPDAILIGEIRDLETADIALQASLTGHIVFSTLHTNSAVGAVPRLVDLGVKAQTIGPALSLVIAQRLVRKVCTSCRAPDELGADLKRKIDAFFKKLPSRVDREPFKNTVLYKSVGCPTCSNIGYKGRLGIYEFFSGGPELEALILKDASEIGLRALAEKQHMVTMQQDGVLKALLGITTFSEVEEATGPIAWPE